MYVYMKQACRIKLVFHFHFPWSKLSKFDSQRACELMVVNVIFSLKELGGGASLFRRLMNKDSLNPQLVCPSKNDWVQWFFRLRDIVYKNLEACIHQIANEAHAISISLDKVTIASRSYTVLTTFLFYHGQIYEFLNELFIMDLGKRKLKFSIFRDQRRNARMRILHI